MEVNTVPFILLGIIGIIGAFQSIPITWWMVHNTLVDRGTQTLSGKKTIMTTLVAIASLAFWAGAGVGIMGIGFGMICIGVQIYRGG